jgi:hypothetical protein
MMYGQDGGLQVSTNSNELLQLTGLSKVTENKALKIVSITQFKTTGKLLFFNYDTSCRKRKILAILLWKNHVCNGSALTTWPAHSEQAFTASLAAGGESLSTVARTELGGFILSET